MFLICSCLTVYLAYVCTVACPTDPIVQQQRIFRKHNLEYDSHSGNRDTKDDMYCNVCNLIVQGRTKHCAQCNRCCAQFDHHCVWLNNCIGIENYKNFRRLIFWFLLFNIFSLALITITAIFGLLSSDSTKISLPIKITIFVQAIFTLVICYVDLSLMLLHVWLVSKGITTYEYIYYKRERKEKQQDVLNGFMT